MSIEEAIQLHGHVVLSVVQRERVTAPALERRIIAKLFEYHEVTHRSRYLALLSFVLRCRAAQLALVTVNDDGMCAHVVLLINVGDNKKIVSNVSGAYRE